MNDAASLEQDRKGRGGMGLAIIGGVFLLTMIGKRPESPPPVVPPDGFFLGAGELSDLSISLHNPIDKFPGDKTGVIAVNFNYRGPAQTIYIGTGIKPDSGFFGVNFDSGAHLVNQPPSILPGGGAGWGFFLLDVPESANTVSFEKTYSNPVGSWTIPDPDAPYLSSRNGEEVRVNFGSADVWIWAASGNLVDAEVGGSYSSEVVKTAVTNEANILVVGSPGNVFNIVRPIVTASLGSLSLAFQ